MEHEHDTPLPDGEIDQERLAGITRLDDGNHFTPDSGLCVMEAVAWVRHQRHTDHPACVHPAIGMVARKINDTIANDQTRTELLLPLVPRLVGTSDADMNVLISAAVDYVGNVNPRSDITRGARSHFVFSPSQALGFAMRSAIAVAQRRKDWSLATGLIDAMIAVAKP